MHFHYTVVGTCVNTYLGIRMCRAFYRGEHVQLMNSMQNDYFYRFFLCAFLVSSTYCFLDQLEELDQCYNDRNTEEQINQENNALEEEVLVQDEENHEI